MTISKKPFEQIEQLGINNNMEPGISYAAPTKDTRLFPRMRSLVIGIQCSPFMHDGYITQYFPNLQELSVFINKRCKKKKM